MTVGTAGNLEKRTENKDRSADILVRIECYVEVYSNYQCPADDNDWNSNILSNARGSRVSAGSFATVENPISQDIDSLNCRVGSQYGSLFEDKHKTVTIHEICLFSDAA